MNFLNEYFINSDTVLKLGVKESDSPGHTEIQFSFKLKTSCPEFAHLFPKSL